MSWWGRRLAWMKREAVLRLQEKKFNLLWKKGWATWGDYKEVARMCRGKIRKAEPQLELNQVTVIKGNRKL